MSWHPSLSHTALLARARLLKDVRKFFETHHVLEVETPLLCPYSVTDPMIDSIAVGDQGFLQTSPEYAMKRLLCAYQHSIYQICKAFRSEQNGAWHHHEFTMLEWYDLGATLLDFIDKMKRLLRTLFSFTSDIQTISYRDLFLTTVSIDPFDCSKKDVLTYLKKYNLFPIGLDYQADCDDLLQIVMTLVIEPLLKQHEAIFIVDYPVKQAALAKLAQRDYGQVAERFELYMQGIECANGFHELQDPASQLKRFEDNQQIRRSMHLTPMAIDIDFIDALEHGLPACTGVAIGLDRLLMLQLNASHIEEVMFQA